MSESSTVANNPEQKANSGQSQTEGQQPAESSDSKQVTALSVKPDAQKSQSLELKPGFLKNRPITASHISVASSFHTMGGDRPVFASQMKTVESFYSSGNRPVSASTLAISEHYSVMGDRPVASNQIDDPTTLMGYID